MIEEIETIRRTHDWIARLVSAPGVYRSGETKDDAIARLLAFLRETRNAG